MNGRQEILVQGWFQWRKSGRKGVTISSQILSIRHCKYSCGALVVHPLPPLCIHAH